MDLLSSMIILAFIYATPILVAATGALYSELSLIHISGPTRPLF